jgi:NO-binding membrane sensor protein with MHYT domain
MIAHDPSLVILSTTIAILGAFTASVLTSNLKSLSRGDKRVRLIMASITLAGSVWAMQFVGLLSFDAPINLVYNPIPLGASAAVIFSGITTAVFLLGMRDKAPASRLSVAVAIFGVAVAAMNYLGIAAIAGPGLDVSWFLTAIAIWISLQVGQYTLWLLFRRRGVVLSIFGAAGLGLCLAASHFLAVASTSGLDRALLAAPAWDTGVSERYLAWAAAIMMYLICSICLSVFVIGQFREDIE